MDVPQLIQLVVSILIPVTLWVVNKAYEESKAERAELREMIKDVRDRQDKIETRIYRLELGFDTLDDPPTHMRKPHKLGGD